MTQNTSPDQAPTVKPAERLTLNVQPVTLTGRYARLEPLTLEHLAGLCEIGLDDDLWRLIPFPVHNADDMRAYVETALKSQREGTALPFATIHQPTGKVAGSTRFGNIDPVNRHVEIGWTWLGRPYQRTPMNTEAKYLMLTHAFETLGCLRVELKTDVLNTRSRNAMKRIGAKEEGIFRSHMITATDRVRDTVYYSIIASEWPEVKEGLERMLARPYPSE